MLIYFVIKSIYFQFLNGLFNYYYFTKLAKKNGSVIIKPIKELKPQKRIINIIIFPIKAFFNLLLLQFIYSMKPNIPQHYFILICVLIE